MSKDMEEMKQMEEKDRRRRKAVIQDLSIKGALFRIAKNQLQKRPNTATQYFAIKRCILEKFLPKLNCRR